MVVVVALFLRLRAQGDEDEMVGCLGGVREQRGSPPEYQ